MTEQEDKTVNTSSPPEIKATTTPPTEPVAKPKEPESKPTVTTKRKAPVRKATAKKPAPKPKVVGSSRKKPAAKPKPQAANSAPDLNTKDFPLHPERIWPD